MEEIQPGAAATGSVGVGTDDTTFIDVVEPSSFVAAGGCLLVHLNCSFSTACPGDTQRTAEFFDVLVEGAQRVVGGVTSKKEGSAKT